MSTDNVNSDHVPKEHTHALRPSGRGGVFLSAKLERIQEKYAGREGRTNGAAEGLGYAAPGED